AAAGAADRNTPRRTLAAPPAPRARPPEWRAASAAAARCPRGVVGGTRPPAPGTVAPPDTPPARRPTERRTSSTLAPRRRAPRPRPGPETRCARGAAG